MPSHLVYRKDAAVQVLRPLRVATAALALLSVLALSSVADAAAPCAWKGQSPCLAKRSQSWFVWGALTDANQGQDVSINVEGFGRMTKKVDGLLADEVGNDDTVRTQSSTRFFVVDSKKHKSRVGADAFWSTIDSYDNPTLYITGRLAAASYWGDDPTNLVASSIVVDLSDLAPAAADLSGAWTLNGQPATLTAADPTNTVYNGTSQGATFTLTIVGGTSACITSYAYTPVPNNATTFTCGPVGTSGSATSPNTIGPLIWSSPVWGTGTWTFSR
jgi:hypothetical protein